MFDLTANLVFQEIAKDFVDFGLTQEELSQIQIAVRPHGLSDVTLMRALGPNDIDRLVTIRGIVIRCTDVIPEMREAQFKCAACQYFYKTPIDRGRIDEPDTCQNCKSKGSFELIHNRCIFGDKQHIKLQENPENIPDGETPQTVHLCAFEELVDFVKPGDRVEVTGIYKAHGVRVNANRRTMKSVYRTYMDVVCFIVTSKDRVKVHDDDFMTSEQN